MSQHYNDNVTSCHVARHPRITRAGDSPDYSAHARTRSHIRRTYAENSFVGASPRVSICNRTVVLSLVSVTPGPYVGGWRLHCCFTSAISLDSGAGAAESVDPAHPRSTLHDIVHLADEFLDDVFEEQDADGAMVLVEHPADVVSCLLHRIEGVLDLVGSA